VRVGNGFLPDLVKKELVGGAETRRAGLISEAHSGVDENAGHRIYAANINENKKRPIIASPPQEPFAMDISEARGSLQRPHQAQ